eukprot:scaffold23351_cov42-Tisochrysis_lutea.AAC.1
MRACTWARLGAFGACGSLRPTSFSRTHSLPHSDLPHSQLPAHDAILHSTKQCQTDLTRVRTAKGQSPEHTAGRVAHAHAH